METLSKWERVALCITSVLFWYEACRYRDDVLYIFGTLVGCASFLNYTFYTGKPNVVSYIDWILVYLGGLAFLLKSLVRKQSINVFFTWMTLFLYLNRRRPGEQIYVHACALVNMWTYQFLEA